MAGISNFYRGDTQTYKLTLKDSSGTPVDLTGCAVWFTMKTSHDDPDTKAVIQVKVTSHTDAEKGITTVVIPATSTDSLTPNATYFYDFQLVTADGTVKTFLSGKVKILPDVTRRTT